MNTTKLPRWTRSTWIRTVGGVAGAALAIGALGGCGVLTESSATTTDAGASISASATASAGLTATEVLAENLDYSGTAAIAEETWDAQDEITIDLSSPAAAEGVEVDGSTVTITQPGTYRLSGELAGQVVVESEDDGVVRLVLDGVDITSPTGAAIDVQDADQVAVVLADGTTNSLEDAAEYADTESDNAANAALYSTADMAISGTGSLEVIGSSNDGITGKDGLVITAGSISVDAVDDGIRGKDYLVISGGTIDVTAGDDGLKADDDSDATAGYIALLDGDVTVDAQDDAVQGYTDVAIAGGTLTVTDSFEGIEAAVIVISGGDVDITASDDGINATVKDAADDATETETGDSVEEPAEDADALAEPPAQPPTDLPEDADGALEEGTAGDRPAPGDGAPGGGGPGGGEEPTEDASLTITGGTVHIVAGMDGTDSNGVTEISGGSLVIETATGVGGDGALDASGSATVTGGTIVTVGNVTTGTLVSTHGWVTLDPSAPVGSLVEVTDADGTVVASATLASEATALGATAEGIIAEESYTISVDGEEVGTATATQTVASSMEQEGAAGGQSPRGASTADDAPSDEVDGA